MLVGARQSDLNCATRNRFSRSASLARYTAVCNFGRGDWRNVCSFVQPVYQSPRPYFSLVTYFFKSPKICVAANLPGAPMTQPPGCVPEPHW